MEQNNFVMCLNGLIDSIEAVLSKNRSSLSITDVTLLENVITSLKELKKVNVVDRKEMLVKMIPSVLRFLVRPEVSHEISRVLDNLLNLN